ncbi:MAG: hypothetical protein HUU44_06025, partial [Ignavibacteriaceae bacterium]|nr:hypothetical protein [Ignavibacteriaceae bacterium]
MKHKSHNLYLLYNPRNWIIITLLLFSVATLAQEQTPPEKFLIGSNLSGLPWRRTVQNYYDSFDSSGMNIVFQYSNDDTKEKLKDYEVIATNGDPNDWIAYYSTCYYTKWEAEQNQEDLQRVGVKHKRGQNWEWHDTLCWSTLGIASTEDSLMYGPHYRQDNRYKSWQHGDRHDVDYYVRFNMALHNPLFADTNRIVCKIKVVYRYAIVYSSTQWVDKDTVFLERTLSVGDFPEGGYFQYFYFDPVQYYEYPAQFKLPKYAGKVDPSTLGYPRYEDSKSDNGIQFWVEWLVPDAEESGLALFVDKVEVFDRDWKEKLIDRNPEISANEIRYYASNYSDWNNLKYWSGHDEPYSIDAFAPIRIVDSILYNNPLLPDKHRLIQPFNPYWTYDNKINGDTLLSQYVRMANPEKLVIDFYPFSPLYPFRGVDAEALRFRFQLCNQLQPGFWYMGQGFGETADGQWWVDRFPDSSELKASVMLALAHGSQGILFFAYDSWEYNDVIYGGNGVQHYIHGLVDTLHSDGTIPVSDLWYLIRDNLSPRLKGKLGNALMSLKYTGDYLQLRRHLQEEPDFGFYNTPPTVNNLYLTLTEYTGDSTPPPTHFHAGFFSRPNHLFDNYFMLDNLITTNAKTVTAALEAPIDGFINYRFRNIEGLFDTTFNENGIVILLTHPAGEGYLYQVAPVIKYGGRLLYSESTQSGMILNDDMIIENGAELTINGTYFAKGN